VKLRGGGSMLADNANNANNPPATGTGGGIVDRRRQVPPDTVFLRNQGYIDDSTNNWGVLNGSVEDKLILSDNDEVYLRIGSDHDVKIGQDLTVYRPVRSVGDGKMIEIQGTVKVDQWNPKERVARARITESLDAIERGASVGPIQRRFEVVPPQRNDKDVVDVPEEIRQEMEISYVRSVSDVLQAVLSADEPAVEQAVAAPA
jgi:hypothetical protein